MTNGITKMVRSIEDEDGPYFTIGDLADYFERSRDTIRRWVARCGGMPTHKLSTGDSGKAFIWLYTEADKRALEKYSADINPKGGRPKNEPDDTDAG